MSRGLAMLSALAVSMLTGCSSPKTKAGGEVVAYLPMTLGDQWVILDQSGPARLEWTHEVTAVEVKDGATFVTISKKFRGSGKSILRKVCDTGEYVLEDGVARYDPPLLVLPATLKEGDRWQWEKPGIGKMTFTAGKEEEVEVPAGKFKAHRIEGEGQSEGKTVKYTQWIAPGLPTIKSVIRIGDDETAEVLKSFTPAKK